MWADVVFVKVLQLPQKVFFEHEFLRRLPPVILENFGIIFHRRSFDFAVAHNAYGVQYLPHAGRWRVQDSDFVDVSRFYCVERIIRLF